MTNIPKAQEIYKHFKGNLYQIVTVAEHTETEESLVVYQALYGDFKVYARPLKMFMGKVDKEKYPEAAQEYRFERQGYAWVDHVEEKSDKPITEAIKEEAVQVHKPVVELKQDEPMQNDELHDEESQLDPMLVEFLDANTYEERLNILAALHHRITDNMITTMAIACDVEVKDGDIEARYAELKNCLLTLDRYEISRLS